MSPIWVSSKTASPMQSVARTPEARKKVRGRLLSPPAEPPADPLIDRPRKVDAGTDAVKLARPVAIGTNRGLPDIVPETPDIVVLARKSGRRSLLLRRL